MIQQQTILRITDNSGGKSVKCIKILGGFRRRFASIGDVIVVSIQQLRNKSKILSKIKKGEIYKGLITKTKKSIKKKDGLVTFFDKNCVVLINKQNTPLGTRIVGPVSKKIKQEKYLKFTAISTGLI
jgi:large subunit ribosomal protein L14